MTVLSGMAIVPLLPTVLPAFWTRACPIGKAAMFSGTAFRRQAADYSWHTGRTLGPHLRRHAGEALDAHPGCELDLDRDIEWQLSHPYRAACVSSSVAEDLD